MKLNIKNLISFDQEALMKDMIHIYCRRNHNRKDGLCDECMSLFLYAQQRLIKCPYGKEKPVCANCKIHCYKKDYRERIKTIMRFSGPKILFIKPVTGMKYLIRKRLLK